MPVLGRPREWRFALDVCLAGTDVLSFQKHLNYSLMPSLGRPREWCQTRFGVSLVGIDPLSFQKHIVCITNNITHPCITLWRKMLL